MSRRDANYMRRLEAAVRDADCHLWTQSRRLLWRSVHIATIRRAKAAETEEPMKVS
jgi:hypothetical protein